MLKLANTYLKMKNLKNLFLNAATRLDRKPTNSSLPRADIDSNFSQASV